MVRRIKETTEWKWHGYKIVKLEDLSFGGWDYVLFLDGFFVTHSQVFEDCKKEAMAGREAIV